MHEVHTNKIGENGERGANTCRDEVIRIARVDFDLTRPQDLVILFSTG